MNVFVDSHCHLDRLDKTPDELAAIVDSAKKRGVEHMLCVSVSVREFPQMLDTVSAFDCVSVSCGVHPLHHEDICPYDELLAMASRPEVVAVGETGLDYYYNADTMDVQKASFADHIKVANITGKPLIIHTRDAREDTIALLRTNLEPGVSGVLHCFTESLEMAKQAIELGLYISISGIVTFRAAQELQEVVKHIPLERLLIETDSPWLAPVPHRGQQNKPEYVVEVAEFIAELKGVTVAQLAQITTDNFYRLFNGVVRHR